MSSEAVVIAFILGSLVVFLACKLFEVRGIMAKQTMDQARAIHERWRKSEFEKAVGDGIERETRAIRLAAKQEIESSAERDRLTFLEWKQQETLRIREEAVKQSNAVHRGKTTEHLVPWLIDDYYDPREIRFLGSPVDLIVFNGLTSGYVESVDFIEVKTGAKPRLSSNEELVRAAVIGKRVTYNLLHVDSDDDNETILRWRNGVPKPLSAKIMDEEMENLMKLRTEAMENLEFTEAAQLDVQIYESMARGIRRLSDEVAILRHELQFERRNSDQ